MELATFSMVHVLHVVVKIKKTKVLTEFHCLAKLSPFLCQLSDWGMTRYHKIPCKENKTQQKKRTVQQKKLGGS